MMNRVDRQLVFRGQRSFGYNPPSPKSKTRPAHMAMFDAWVEGPSARGRLIHEARKQGFDGLAFEKYEGRKFIGNETPAHLPPRAIELFDHLDFIYWEGAQGNLVQHGGGEGVYLWRESRHGYEFMMFDYGPGARDEYDRPQQELGRIFDPKVSFRQGQPSLADGKYWGGRQGTRLQLSRPLYVLGQNCFDVPGLGQGGGQKTGLRG